MSPVTTFTNKILQPLRDPDQARIVNINLIASTTFLAGQLLAESVANPGRFQPYVGTKVATPAGAPVPTEGAAGTLAAGTYTLVYTYVTANGETIASPAAAVTIAGSKQIAVAAVTPLPAGATSVNWYMSVAAGSPVLGKVANNNGAAFSINALPAAAAIIGPPATSTAFTATDGGQVAKLILREDCVTDASRNITHGSAAVVTHDNPSSLYTQAYRSGEFDTRELVGLDQNAVDQLGRIVTGTIAAGVLRLT